MAQRTVPAGPAHVIPSSAPGWAPVWGLPLAAGLLVLLVGYLAAAHRPEESSVALWWPVAGVSVGAYAVAWRRQQRLTVLAALALGVFGAELVAGYSPAASLWLALANIADPVLCIGLLSRVLPDLRLRDARDFARFCTAALAGVLATAAIAATPVHLLLEADVWTVMRAVVPSHLSAVLVIAPLALLAPRRPAPAGRVETTVQVTTLVLVTLWVFAPGQDLPFTFLCIGFLIWGAARVSAPVMWSEVVLVAVIGAVTTTWGWGSYAAAVTAYRLPPETMATLLDVMILGVPLAVWPLWLAMDVHRASLAEVRESRELLDSVLEGATGTAIVGAGLDGTITSWNTGAERVFGWSAPQVVGLRSVTALRTAPAERSLDALVAPLLAGRAWVDQDWECSRADGRQVTVAVRVTARRSADDAVLGWIVVGEDVTEKRRTERALQDALERERQAVQRLEDLDAVKTAFVQSVSHELRTPMTSVLGYTDMLMEERAGDLNDRQRRMLTSVARNGRRLLTLIEDLLLLSRVEQRSPTAVTERLDLRTSVQRGCEAVAPQAESASVRLATGLGPGPTPVIGDPDQLERLTVNLVGNAVKFSPAGSTVEVSVATRDGEAVLTVSDRGMGVPEDEVARLFERFFRSSNAQRAEVQGSGLGLAIVKEVVDHHDGQVEVESEEGVGTTVRVRLPLQAPTPTGPRAHPDSTRADTTVGTT